MAGEKEQAHPAGRHGVQTGARQRPSLRASVVVFQYRDYRFLWTSAAFAFVAMQIQQVARALLAWDLTHSFGVVGAVSLSFGLPMLLFSLIGGSLADRLEKRNLSLMTHAGVGVLSTFLAILVLTDTITIQALVLVGLVQGTLFALGNPARTPLMAEVVGPSNVMAAIAMSNAAMNATRLIGPAIAGGLVALWGIEAAYFTQASMYLLSCITLLMVPTGLSEAAGNGRRRSHRGMFREIGEGLRYVGGDQRMRRLILMLLVVTFLANPYVVLLPGFVQEDLGKGAGAFGILQSVAGAGALVGSLGVATLTTFDRKPFLQWILAITGAGGLILLAALTLPFGYLGAFLPMAIVGLTFTAYQTLNNGMLMNAARPEYYGRVMSINMLTFSAMPLMAYPLGAVADHLGARETFTLQGGIIIAAMALSAIFNANYTFGRQTRSAGRLSLQDDGQPTAASPLPRDPEAAVR